MFVIHEQGQGAGSSWNCWYKHYSAFKYQHSVKTLHEHRFSSESNSSCSDRRTTGTDAALLAVSDGCLTFSNQTDLRAQCLWISPWGLSFQLHSTWYLKPNSNHSWLAWSLTRFDDRAFFEGCFWLCLSSVHRSLTLPLRMIYLSLPMKPCDEWFRLASRQGSSACASTCQPQRTMFSGRLRW